MSKQQPRVFGKYLLLELISSSPRAEVHFARELAQPRSPGSPAPLALKIFANTSHTPKRPSSLSATSGARIETRDAGQAAGTPYIAMDWIPSRGLAAFAARFRERAGTPPPHELLAWIAARATENPLPRSPASTPAPSAGPDFGAQDILLSTSGAVRLTAPSDARAVARIMLELSTGTRAPRELAQVLDQASRGEIADLASALDEFARRSGSRFNASLLALHLQELFGKDLAAEQAHQAKLLATPAPQPEARAGAKSAAHSRVADLCPEIDVPGAIGEPEPNSDPQLHFEADLPVIVEPLPHVKQPRPDHVVLPDRRATQEFSFGVRHALLATLAALALGAGIVSFNRLREPTPVSDSGSGPSALSLELKIQPESAALTRVFVDGRPAPFEQGRIQLPQPSEKIELIVLRTGFEPFQQTISSRAPASIVLRPVPNR